MVKGKNKTTEEKQLILNSKLFSLFLLAFLLVVTLVPAQEVISEQIQSFQFNTEFDLKRACFDNGFFCGTSFTCNITLVSPDGTILVDNVIMGNQNSYRNVTVPQLDNDQLGYVHAIESCSNGTLAGPDTFTVAITGDGKSFEIFPQQFVIIILAIFMIFVGMLNDRVSMIKTMGAVILFVMGVITIYPGYSFINYSNLLGLTLGTVFIGMGFYFMINDSFSRDRQQEGFDQQPEVFQ